MNFSFLICKLGSTIPIYKGYDKDEKRNVNSVAENPQNNN